MPFSVNSRKRPVFWGASPACRRFLRRLPAYPRAAAVPAASSQRSVFCRNGAWRASVRTGWLDGHVRMDATRGPRRIAARTSGGIWVQHSHWRSLTNTTQSLSLCLIWAHVTPPSVYLAAEPMVELVIEACPGEGARLNATAGRPKRQLSSGGPDELHVAVARESERHSEPERPG